MSKTSKLEHIYATDEKLSPRALKHMAVIVSKWKGAKIVRIDVFVHEKSINLESERERPCADQ